jgi:hypothetical protein
MFEHTVDRDTALLYEWVRLLESGEISQHRDGGYFGDDAGYTLLSEGLDYKGPLPTSACVMGVFHIALYTQRRSRALGVPDALLDIGTIAVRQCGVDTTKNYSSDDLIYLNDHGGVTFAQFAQAIRSYLRQREEMVAGVAIAPAETVEV